MTKEFIIRDKPRFRLILTDSSLEVENVGFPKGNTLLSFSEISHVEIVKREINWFVTIFSTLVETLFLSSAGSIYKSKNKLRISTNSTSQDFVLNDCNIAIVEEAVNEIKRKL